MKYSSYYYLSQNLGELGTGFVIVTSVIGTWFHANHFSVAPSPRTSLGMLLSTEVDAAPGAISAFDSGGGECHKGVNSSRGGGEVLLLSQNQPAGSPSQGCVWAGPGVWTGPTCIGVSGKIDYVWARGNPAFSSSSYTLSSSKYSCQCTYKNKLMKTPNGWKYERTSFHIYSVYSFSKKLVYVIQVT